jgi:molybdopterin-binding protein
MDSELYISYSYCACKYTVIYRIPETVSDFASAAGFNAALTNRCLGATIAWQMARNSKLRPSTGSSEEMLKLREAALELRISFPTIKQWIYKKRIRSIKTAGGHHRIPQREVDRLLYRTRNRAAAQGTLTARQVSGRNQLVGRIEAVRLSGLMAEVKISIGDQQITSIITASSAREMKLKPGQTAAALIKSTEVMILRI